MIKIQAICSECREVVQVKGKDVILLEPAQVIYFTCPECLQPSRNQVPSQEVMDRLLEGLPAPRIVQTPPDAPKPQEPQAPLFTTDDLIDFHFSLDEELRKLLG